MGHSVIVCDNCNSDVMEGRNSWKCDTCGYEYSVHTGWEWSKKGSVEVEKVFKVTSNCVPALNKFLSEVFPEMDGSLENRNVYVEEGALVKWVDGVWPNLPTKEVIRTLTKGELEIWASYKSIIETLYSARK